MTETDDVINTAAEKVCPKCKSPRKTPDEKGWYEFFPGKFCCEQCGAAGHIMYENGTKIGRLHPYKDA